MRFVDLAKGDGLLLRRFYAELYVGEFPDRNERESLDNMLAYLERGNGEANGYLVTLLLDGDQILAGCVADYFGRSSCGAIEFLVVADSRRGAGLGVRLAERIEERMRRKARELRRELALVFAEINDPFKRSATPDNVDPFLRLGFWKRLGYRHAAFPYRQPALSAEQACVENLLLAAKPAIADGDRQVSAALIELFLRDYLTFAMRIGDPGSQPEFVVMADYLAAHDRIPLKGLDAYIGEDPARSVDVRRIGSPSEADFQAVMNVYRNAFFDPELAVPDESFTARLAAGDAGSTYHLWALRATAGGDVSGMVSFFGLPAAGFGGYLVLAGALRGSGRLRTLLARIERALVGDCASTHGWYIECETHVAPVFEHCGFFRIGLPYRQPALVGESAVPLNLLYKNFGESYGPPRLRKEEFVAAMGGIGSAIYRLDPAASARWLAALSAPIAHLPGEASVPFAT
jgi:GNAT superfamily N-acetyltransferase